jgi:hypothetical protein
MKGRITTISRILLETRARIWLAPTCPTATYEVNKIGGANLQFNGVNNTQVEIDVRLLART